MFPFSSCISILTQRYVVAYKSGMDNIVELSPKARIVQSADTWIEGEAVRQLEATATFPGMKLCVAMPDVHPAKGSPNGAAFLADRLYPSLVGNDDGCGVSLSVTTLLARKAKLDRIIDRVNGLDEPWDGDTAKWLVDREVAPTDYDGSLGTPGFGNHFIEIQSVSNIFDQTLFDSVGMSEDHLHVVVHSGSRGFGESIMDAYAAKHGANGVMADSDEGQAYLKQNDHAIRWAVANRQLCAHRVLEAIGTDGTQLIDICHNSVTEAMADGCTCWLHRKGAAPADKGPVIIPGSRNAMSYVVQPVEGKEEALRSLAHGAGRKIARGDAFSKLSGLYRGKDIKKNDAGGRVVCGNDHLLWEEAPECYKPINVVITDLWNAGLIQLIATLRPLVTFKTSEGVEEQMRKDRKKWQQERSKAREAKGRR